MKATVSRIIVHENEFYKLVKGKEAKNLPKSLEQSLLKGGLLAKDTPEADPTFETRGVKVPEKEHKIEEEEGIFNFRKEDTE